MNILRLVPLAIGGLLGLVCVGLGVAALVTSQWIKNSVGTYSLLIPNKPNLLPTSRTFQAVQGLLIAGLGATALGLLAALVVGVLVNNRWIRLLPQLLLLSGPIAILVGLILYVKGVFDNFSDSLGGAATVELKFSIIFMLVSCILGFVLSTYFAIVNSAAGTSQNLITRRSTGSMYVARF